MASSPGARDEGGARHLIIVRHAKAQRVAPGQSDFDRALSPRGQSQCEQLRGWATDNAELGRFAPASALVSSALRTRETMARSFEGTGFVSTQVESERIYNGRRHVGAEDVLLELSTIDQEATSLVVVGHNPTVVELLWWFVGERASPLGERFPVGAAFVVALGDEWTTRGGSASLVAYYVPD